MVKDEKEQAEWFYRFWVLKESFMKATRRGMGLDMRTYEFAWRPGWHTIYEKAA